MKKENIVRRVLGTFLLSSLMVIGFQNCTQIQLPFPLSGQAVPQNSGSLGSNPPTISSPPPASCALTPEQLMPSWASQYTPTIEYYISPSGSDSNNGLSPSTAFLTSEHAIKMVAPGVRLNFSTGTYDCVTFQGTSSNTRGTAKPFEIRSLDGPRAAKFNCAGTGEMWFQQVHGLILEGIEVYNSSVYAIFILSNNPFDPSNLASDVVIHNSYIHDTAGVKGAQAKNITIIGTEFANINVAGRQMVQMVAVDNVVLAGNTGHDSMGAFDEIKGGAHGATLFQNLVYNANGGILVGGDETGTQYLVDPTVNFEAENMNVWNNVIINDSINAFRIVGCHNCVVANNTFWTSSSEHALMIIADEFENPNGSLIPLHNVNVQIVNNIFASASTFVYMIGDSNTSDVINMTNNVWWWASGGAIGSDIPYLGEPASIYVNPMLVSPSTNLNSMASSLNPMALSPIVGKGIPISFVTDNANGICWSGNPNIGAY